MEVTSVCILILGTLCILVFTWQFSIRKKRFHGIPRFFAFESILVLLFLNAPIWSEQPLSWNQIVSWILLFTSIFFAVGGFYLLYRVGKPKHDIEDTAKLVVIGLYRFHRHPMYASLALLGFGVFFKHITLMTTVLAVINFFALIATAKIEEQEMLEKFGKEYIDYMKSTKMFIPFIF